ncbi:MAG: nucleotidyltransferase domain-containing protein, partial [Proteobacteria bacterium]|nr:nucleotidyltransferase domain-containing protein [Pseudomonadota bacterium]
MENTDIAEIFNEIADLMEIKGDNPFKIRAYRNAAQVIEDLPITLESIVEREEKDLEDLPGIGKALHEKIVEIIKTGRCSFLDELFKELPSGLLDMLKVSGIGPKKVKVIYEVLAVSSLDELEEAAREGRLKHLPGMGEKTETNILKSIKTLKASAGRYGIADAMQIAEEFTGYLKELSGVIKAVPAGSLRRGRETVGDIDILVTSKKDTPVMEKFVSHPRVERILGKGETKSSIVLKSGLQIDLRVVEEKAFGAALHYFSGSKQHNVAIRDRAKKMGLKISEYGVFRGSDHSWLAGKTEEEVFKAVGLGWIPPELRENRGEMEAAEHETLPELININDIIGDL